MAEALALYLTELCKNLEAQAHSSHMTNVFMNYLRKLMLGYENDAVNALLTEIKEGMIFRLYMPRFKRQTIAMIIENCEKLCDIRFSSNTETPNLRKLGFCGPLKSRIGDLEFPNIRSLEHLQKLKLLNTTPYPEPTKTCNPLLFPEKLQKLTLSNTGLDWEEIWTFAWLPNLEVLKLRFDACIGEKWKTSDNTVFRKLKVLKMHDLDLRQWVSSSNNFPRLQCLVVRRCLNLVSIPSGLGKILTLDMIEVSGCSSFAQSSALEIQKEQESEGNYFLKVHVNNNASGTRLDWTNCRKRQRSQIGLETNCFESQTWSYLVCGIWKSKAATVHSSSVENLNSFINLMDEDE
ncbi:hypothetical protein L1887_15903 [Cichorium endivia]|nr:hypothetical protein L1887_15903 [Cichorium endivia]